MKKTLIIVGAGILLLGLVYWKMTSKIGNQTGKPETAGEAFTGNLMAAMKRGVPMKCSWQSQEDSGESFVQGENLYVTTTVEGKHGYMIKKGDCVWTWGDNQPQGIKICQEPEEVEPSEADDWTPESGSYQAEGVDWNIEYHCQPAVFGADKFTPPSTVQFLDMESMLKGLGVPVEPAE